MCWESDFISHFYVYLILLIADSPAPTLVYQHSWSLCLCKILHNHCSPLCGEMFILYNCCGLSLDFYTWYQTWVSLLICTNCATLKLFLVWLRTWLNRAMNRVTYWEYPCSLETMKLSFQNLSAGSCIKSRKISSYQLKFLPMFWLNVSVIIRAWLKFEQTPL